jgi:hypothetical protein
MSDDSSREEHLLNLAHNVSSAFAGTLKMLAKAQARMMRDMSFSSHHFLIRRHRPTVNGSKNRASRKPASLLALKAPGPQRHGHRQALGVGRASVNRIYRGGRSCGPTLKATLRSLLPAPRRPIVSLQ